MTTDDLLSSIIRENLRRQTRWYGGPDCACTPPECLQYQEWALAMYYYKYNRHMAGVMDGTSNERDSWFILFEEEGT